MYLVINSGIHSVWAHRPGSTTHEGRATYLGEAFETFPLPQMDRVREDVGVRLDGARKRITAARGEGLTKTYNRFHDAADKGDDIGELRELHAEMDSAVLRAYGWKSPRLDHGFHETMQGRRYTISEGARTEIIERVLALNQERFAEEIAAGLHPKDPTEGRTKPPRAANRRPAKKGKQMSDESKQRALLEEEDE